jgi:hypothetical protein
MEGDCCGGSAAGAAGGPVSGMRNRGSARRKGGRLERGAGAGAAWRCVSFPLPEVYPISRWMKRPSSDGFSAAAGRPERRGGGGVPPGAGWAVPNEDGGKAWPAFPAPVGQARRAALCGSHGQGRAGRTVHDVPSEVSVRAEDGVPCGGYRSLVLHVEIAVD